MGIEANCRQCGKQYTVPDSWAGKHVQCPGCNKLVEIATPVVDIVVTGDDVPSPFIDPLEGSSPFAQPPATTRSGPWKVVAQDQLPNPLQKPISKPGRDMSTTLLQDSSLMIATGVGMGLVLISALVVGIRVGFSFWLVPHALLLAAGATILMFSKSNVFRTTSIGYIVLAVVASSVMIPLGIMGSFRPADAPAGVGDQRADLQPSSAPHTIPPHSARDVEVPSAPADSTKNGSNREGPERQGLPGGSPFDRAMGGRGRFSGRPSPGSDVPGSGFRGPPSSRPGTGGRGARPNPPSFESSVATLVSRFGAERVVTVLAEPVEGNQFQQFNDSIRTAANAERAGLAASLSNGMLRVAVGPVNDIRAFAERLDIGKVSNVDVTRRTITVDARGP